MVSQFTLYVDCKKGNRPAFTEAADPISAKHIYKYMIRGFSNRQPKVEAGEFGADMKVALMNDGPFTIVLDESMF